MNTQCVQDIYLQRYISVLETPMIVRFLKTLTLFRDVRDFGHLDELEEGAGQANGLMIDVQADMSQIDTGATMLTTAQGRLADHRKRLEVVRQGAVKLLKAPEEAQQSLLKLR